MLTGFAPADEQSNPAKVLIMRQHQTRATMMTSNRSLEDWGKLLGDVPIATAILDHFLQDAEIIQITGRSYRLRNKAAGSDSSQPAKVLTGSEDLPASENARQGRQCGITRAMKDRQR